VAVSIAKEHRLLVVAPLGDVMRESWHDETRHPGHVR
jgi:hypothetical protein